MLTYKDCLDWAELEQGEVDAIGEHEHLDRFIALAYGDNLNHQRDGARRMRKILIDDIRVAQRHHDFRHAQELKQTLTRHIKNHPL
ncbi:hypothetical protein [Motiliproteus sp.]|uniref:hypothetical protein n=1 Tax=Motiliproteus sp. TaxID=1898955 RepID=UPI003BACBA0E